MKSHIWYSVNSTCRSDSPVQCSKILRILDILFNTEPIPRDIKDNEGNE